MTMGSGIPTTALPGGGSTSAYGTGFPTASQPGAGSSFEFPISFGSGAGDATLNVSMDGSQPTLTFANGESTTLPELANTLSAATLEGAEGDAAREQLLEWGFSEDFVNSLLPPDTDMPGGDDGGLLTQLATDPMGTATDVAMDPAGTIFDVVTNPVDAIF